MQTLNREIEDFEDEILIYPADKCAYPGCKSEAQRNDRLCDWHRDCYNERD